MIVLPMGMSVLIGGARSGKSDLVVDLGESWPDAVVFAATATAGDSDMAARIARHRADRPSEWALLERPELSATDVAQVAGEALLIVDCLTMLVANLLFAEPAASDGAAGAEHETSQAVMAHVSALGAALASRRGPTLVVTNEVGLGVHPTTALGRQYRDLLGRANRAMVDCADAALFVVAGRAIELQPVATAWQQR